SALSIYVPSCLVSSPCSSRSVPLPRLFFSSCVLRRDPRSFPTRRSSDLGGEAGGLRRGRNGAPGGGGRSGERGRRHRRAAAGGRSEEHTSELQSRFDLVCRLLLEKKKRNLGERVVGKNAAIRAGRILVRT